MTKPIVNVLYAPGTNSHKETLHAFRRAGAEPRLLFLSDVLRGFERLDSGDATCIPGGFSYGDHIGAGSLEGQILRNQLGSQLTEVRKRPMIAICNGFQVAVRSGIFGSGVALAENEAGTFCNRKRQAHIVSSDTKSVWLQGLGGTRLHFPCAHGEGRFVWESNEGWHTALTYPEGTSPDGSQDDIAGISTDDGLVLGLMNHPERLLDEPGNLDIFVAGVKAAA